MGLSFKIIRIFEDEDNEESEEEDREKDLYNKEHDMEVDDDLQIEDLMNNINQDDDAEEKRTFRFVERNQSQLYVFEKKDVAKLYSILMNYVISIIHGMPFGQVKDQNTLKAYQTQIIS